MDRKSFTPSDSATISAGVDPLLGVPLDQKGGVAYANDSSQPNCFQWSPFSAEAFTTLQEGIPPGNSQYKLYFLVNFDYFQGHVNFTSSGAPSSISIAFNPSSLYVPSGSSFTNTPVILTISTPPTFSGSFNMLLAMNSSDGNSYENVCAFRNITQTIPVRVGKPHTQVTVITENGYTGLLADNIATLNVNLKATDGDTGKAVPNLVINVDVQGYLQRVDSHALRLKKPADLATYHSTVTTNETGFALIIIGPWDTPLVNPVNTNPIRPDPSNMNMFRYESIEITIEWQQLQSLTYSSITQEFKVYQPPVLLVHGTCSDSTTWNSEPGFPGTLDTRVDFVKSLAAYGILARTTDYSSGFQSTDDITNQWTVIQKNMTQMTRDLANQHIKGQRFDIIAHSLGGLVTRYYTQQDPNERVNKLIFLGTTNNGFYEWSSLLANFSPIAHAIANLFDNKFLGCLTGNAPIIREQNPEDQTAPNLGTTLAAINAWGPAGTQGNGLNPQVRYYAIMGNSSMAGRGGGDDDGLVKHGSTTLNGSIVGYYVPGNHIDLTGSQDVVNVAVPLLLGNPVPPQYSHAPASSPKYVLYMLAGTGQVYYGLASQASQTIQELSYIPVTLGQLLVLPVGSSASLTLPSGTRIQVGQGLFLGSQSQSTVAELGGLGTNSRTNVMLYKGDVGVVVPASNPVSVFVPNQLSEIRDDGAAFAVSVWDNASYSVTVLEGNVTLRYMDGSSALTVGPLNQVFVSPVGVASPLNMIKSNWAQEASLIDYFRYQNLTVNCQEFFNSSACAPVSLHRPTVRAYDSKGLAYIGQAVSCDDLQTNLTRTKLMVFSARVMASGNSKGQNVPLIISAPNSCVSQLNQLINNIGIAQNTHVWYLVTGNLVRPSIISTTSTTTLSTSRTATTTITSSTTRSTTVTSSDTGSQTTTQVTPSSTDAQSQQTPRLEHIATGVGIAVAILAAGLVIRMKRK
ncbi:MAG: alpha/beta hydrolase [Thaumarchaeota archaeon]|nr:alpha/beta hydrolase [Nitrososphaerota archaeon]MCL5318064.1 alpha/beta hydrolase [Nitrososphaerota archaeon]